MKLIKALFGMSSFFASEVNIEVKKMGIHRGQDLESVRYIPLIKHC